MVKSGVGRTSNVPGIQTEEFARLYPRLFHMAEAGSWPGIQEHGLLSTSALLTLYGVAGKQRMAIEDQRRDAMVVLRSAGFPDAHVRDNLPMRDQDLRRCLRDGLSPSEWYRILNERVFFWVEEPRLQRLLHARSYRDRSHDVLVVRTAPLLMAYETRVTLSPINSGATRPVAQPRGRDTFLPLQQYPFQEWKARRRGREPVVECAIQGGVPDIVRYVERVERHVPGRSPVVLVGHKTYGRRGQ